MRARRRTAMAGRGGRRTPGHHLGPTRDAQSTVRDGGGTALQMATVDTFARGLRPPTCDARACACACAWGVGGWGHVETPRALPAPAPAPARPPALPCAAPAHACAPALRSDGRGMLGHPRIIFRKPVAGAGLPEGLHPPWRLWGAECRRNGDITRAVLGIPRWGGQNQKRLHTPCRLGGPHVGKMASSRHAVAGLPTIWGGGGGAWSPCEPPPEGLKRPALFFLFCSCIFQIITFSRHVARLPCHFLEPVVHCRMPPPRPRS